MAAYEKSKGNSLRRYEIYICYPSYLVAEYGLSESCRYIVKNLPLDRLTGNTEKCTPLHTAAKFGHVDICRILLENADDKNPPDINGVTPLHVAAKEGHLEVCKILLESIW